MMNLWLLLITFSFAQISEQEIVAHLLEQFPSVQIAQSKVKAAEGKQVSASGAFDITLDGQWLNSAGEYNYDYLDTKLNKPTALFGLDLYAGYRKSRGNVPAYYGEQVTMSDGEWSVGFKIPLLRNFLIDANRLALQKSEIETQKQKLELRATELKTVELALASYWDWCAALEKWKIQKELLVIAETRNSWLEKRAKSGDIAKFDLDDNLRTILVRRSALLQAELDLTRKSEQFIVYVANSPIRERVLSAKDKPDRLPLSWKIPENVNYSQSNIDNLVQKAKAERPEFAVISAELQQLEMDRQYQKNQFLPKLDLKGEYSKESGMAAYNLDGENTKVYLNFQIPLQYRLNRGKMQEVRAKTNVLEKQQELLDLQWKADITQFVKNFEVAVLRNQLSNQEYELAQRLEKGERLRLRQGDANIFMVNQREQATAEASIRVIETTVDSLKAHVQLETRIGKIPYQP